MVNKFSFNIYHSPFTIIFQRFNFNGSYKIWRRPFLATFLERFSKTNSEKYGVDHFSNLID